MADTIATGDKTSQFDGNAGFRIYSLGDTLDDISLENVDKRCKLIITMN